MMPIILIIAGIILCFVSAIMLIRFSTQVQDKISEINALFSSDVFLMHKELREELDELNFSYYEILERQDERISSLESVISTVVSDSTNPVISTAVSDSTNPVISTAVSDSERSGEISPEPSQTSNSVISTAVSDSERSGEISSESIELTKANTETSVRRSREISQDTNPINSQVLAKLAEGASREEIASELDIGVGVVNMICEVYAK